MNCSKKPVVLRTLPAGESIEHRLRQTECVSTGNQEIQGTADGVCLLVIKKYKERHTECAYYSNAGRWSVCLLVIKKYKERHTECAYYCNAGNPATISTVSKLTVITCPSNRTINCGSSARFGSLTMPLRLSVFTQY